MLEVLIGGDLAIAIEVGTEVAVPEDDGSGEALMEVGEERAQGLLLGFGAGVGRGAVWC